MLTDPRGTVGILIPTYNRLHYLKIALQSVLEQSHSDLSILVIDDTSTDGTPEYLRGIRDPRFSYILNECNLGLAGNINKGIPLVPGNVEWCTILCDDDMMDKDFIRAMLDAVRFFSPKSIVHGHRIIIDKDGRHVRHTKGSPSEESAPEYLVNRLCKYRETFLTGVFFRTDIFRKIGGYPSFRTGATADDAFIFALALQDRLVYTKYAMACQRFHQNAESLSFQDMRAILETTKQFRGYCEEVGLRYGIPGNIPQAHFRKILGEYSKVINSDCWLQCYRNTIYPTRDTNSDLDMPDIPNIHPDQFSRRTRLDAYGIRKFRVFLEDYISYRALWFFLELFTSWGRRYRLKW